MAPPTRIVITIEQDTIDRRAWWLTFEAPGEYERGCHHRHGTILGRAEAFVARAMRKASKA